MLKKKNKSDIFKSYLLSNASYSSIWEIPKLNGSHLKPTKIIPFSKALTSTDYEAWVGFYEDDSKFIRVWRNPRRYLPILRRFQGVISPDFSLYRNMPLIMQAWSVFKSRALAHWWEINGIEVIPNIRFSTQCSYPFAFAGIKKYSTVAVGIHGCWHKNEDRKYFKKGFITMVDVLKPKCIVIYGTEQKVFFNPFRERGIEIICFPSSCELAHKKVHH